MGSLQTCDLTGIPMRLVYSIQAVRDALCAQGLLFSLYGHGTAAETMQQVSSVGDTFTLMAGQMTLHLALLAAVCVQIMEILAVPGAVCD